MSTTGYFATVALTALGGFDPTPLLIIAAALGAGVPRRHVVGFVVVLVGGTAAWGVVLTVIGGQRLARVDWHDLVRGGSTAAWLETVLGVVLAGYALWRVWRKPRPKRPRRAVSVAGLYATAAGYVAIVIFDLSFDVLVRASASQPLLVAIPGWITWAVLTQLPATLLGIAAAWNHHQVLAGRLSRVWSRLAPAAGTLVSACLLLAGLVLIADAAEFLAQGRFLLP